MDVSPAALVNAATQMQQSQVAQTAQVWMAVGIGGNMAAKVFDRNSHLRAMGCRKWGARRLD